MLGKFVDVTYQEIESYIRLTGTPLTAWECEMLVILDNRYKYMYQKFDNTNDPAPYSNTETVRSDVASGLARLRAYANG